MLQINAGLATETQARFDGLVAEREAETIAPAELEELIELADTIEHHDGVRLEALQALAQLRQTTRLL